MAVLAGLPAEAWAERRVALVIGNSDYAHASKLPNPRNDASAVADLLKSAKFDLVEFRKDLSGQDMRRAIREFQIASRDADVAVVFFAGHGIEVSGTNYMVPTDAKLANDLDAEDEAISLDRVLRALEGVKRLRLVILDACRDNPLSTTMKRTFASRAVSAGLAKIEPGTDTLVAFAAKAGSTADDGSGKNSPFTTALLKHLATPGLDIRIALGKVRDDVFNATNRKQEPFVYGSLGGDTVALVKVAAVDTAGDARRDFELAKEIGTRDAYELFLARHPQGYYSGLARAALGKLNVPPAPRLDESAPSSPEEARLWDRVKDSNDREALRSFIERFPNSPRALQAQRKLDELGRNADDRATKELKDKSEREQAAERERLGREKAQQDRAAREQAERDRLQREQQSRDQAARDRAAKEQAAREAREQAERDRADRDRAAREAREQAQRDKAQREQAAIEKLHREQEERGNASPRPQDPFKEGRDKNPPKDDEKKADEKNLDERNPEERKPAPRRKDAVEREPSNPRAGRKPQREVIQERRQERRAPPRRDHAIERRQRERAPAPGAREFAAPRGSGGSPMSGGAGF